MSSERDRFDEAIARAACWAGNQADAYRYGAALAVVMAAKHAAYEPGLLDEEEPGEIISPGLKRVREALDNWVSIVLGAP